MSTPAAVRWDGRLHPRSTVGSLDELAGATHREPLTVAAGSRGTTWRVVIR